MTASRKLKISPKPTFDIDAMAAHTWVADENLRVRTVNHSYREWLTRNLPEVAKQISRRGGMALADYLTSCFALSSDGLRTVLAQVESLRGPLREQLPLERKSWNGVEMRRELLISEDTPIGNVRVAAITRRLGNEKLDMEMHQLLLSTQFRGSDEGWVLHGLQGMVQSVETRRAPADFDPNAMLVHSWVADKNQRVVWVNRSFRSWLGNHLRSALDKVNEPTGVPLGQFLKDTLQLTEEVQHAINERLLQLETVAKLLPKPGTMSGLPKEIFAKKLAQLLPAEESFAPPGIEVKRYLELLDSQWVMGIRAVAVNGFAMKGTAIELVDVVIVAQLRQAGENFEVRGYQGLMQSANSRADLIFAAGTRSGAVALMGRNLSHNIGSHALYWMEQESMKRHRSREREARAAQKRAQAEAGGRKVRRLVVSVDSEDSRHALFFKYMRERTELLAGFATNVPLSPRTMGFRSLLEGFTKNKLLLERLCRSEGVTSLVLPYDERREFKVSIPGGAMGAQAFYSLLENIIRDNAKYGPHEDCMTTRIETKIFEDEERRDYLRVSIIGQEAGNTNSAYEKITGALANLRISDETGQLTDGHWGIKERFIAATLLRQKKVADIGFRSTTKDNRPFLNWNLARKLEGEPITLDVRKEGSSLVWDFFLLRAKDVLLIGNHETDQLPEATEAQSFAWLREALPKETGIRQAFVSIDPGDATNAQWLMERRDRLPYRTFVTGSIADQIIPADMFARLGSGWEHFDVEEMYPKWLQFLDEDLEGKFLLVQRMDGKRVLRWNEEQDVAISEDVFDEMALQPGCLGIFYRHWPNQLPPRGLGQTRHIEIYGNTPSIEQICNDGISGIARMQMFESVLIRALVVDERLDESADEIIHSDPNVTWRELLAMKGVDVAGREYSGETVPKLDRLLELANGKNGKPYHFICIHRGVLDKLENLHGIGVQEVCAALGSLTANLLVHSGRVGRANLPRGVKIVPLSNVVTWMEVTTGKLDIVSELCLIRRSD
jgi:hypothetical protein